MKVNVATKNFHHLIGGSIRQASFVSCRIQSAGDLTGANKQPLFQFGRLCAGGKTTGSFFDDYLVAVVAQKTQGQQPAIGVSFSLHGLTDSKLTEWCRCPIAPEVLGSGCIFYVHAPQQLDYSIATLYIYIAPESRRAGTGGRVASIHSIKWQSDALGYHFQIGGNMISLRRYSKRSNYAKQGQAGQGNKPTQL